MDRLDDMLAFIRVVDTRSFTAAAEKLGLSKSAVSRRMTDLENRLGARLLNRTTRSLSVTEVGQAFYERCSRIVADVEEAERAVADLYAEPRGTLKINAPMSFGMIHLAPAIAEFLRRHPGLEIDMDLNDRFVDLIEDGYDVAVRIGRLRDSSLVARRLAPNRHVVVGSPGLLQDPWPPDAPGRPGPAQLPALHQRLAARSMALHGRGQALLDQGFRHAPGQQRRSPARSRPCRPGHRDAADLPARRADRARPA